MPSRPQRNRDFAEINGARLAYEIAGQGRPLVLIHAGIADSRMWDDPFDAFAQQFTVVRYDIRGSGQSVMPARTYSDRDDLFGLLRTLGIAPASLLGVSIGAMIALDFTLDHPEMVEALVLTSPALGGVTASALSQQQDAAIDALYEAGDLAGAVELELRRWVDGPHRSPDLVDAAVREKVRAMDTDNFELVGEGGEELPLEPPAVGRLQEIRVPTLVIVGDGDVPETLEHAERLIAGIVGARKEVIRGAAHMLSEELLLQSQGSDGQASPATSELMRVHTLSALHELDAGRKPLVLQLVYEAGLIDVDRPMVSIAGASLRGAVLRGLDLTEADLAGADLTGADLRGANLYLANLRDALLREADLEGAMLAGADLGGAELEGANLRQAVLEGANLASATGLADARVDPDSLSRAWGVDDALPSGPGDPSEFRPLSGPPSS